MYSIRKKQSRFWVLSDNCLEDIETKILKISPMQFQDRERFIYALGLLNTVWQNWSSFWRTFWLAQLLGGLDKNNCKMTRNAIALSVDENKAIFQLLYLLGKRRRPEGIINGSYQEPTWGDRDNIETLSLEFFGQNINLVSNALSIYGTTVYHLQLVRNASIHLDRDNINRVKNEVLPYYALSSLKYPTDILFAKDLSTGKTVVKSWIEDLNALLLLI